MGGMTGGGAEGANLKPQGDQGGKPGAEAQGSSAEKDAVRAKEQAHDDAVKAKLAAAGIQKPE